MSVLAPPRRTAFEDPREESALLLATVIAEAVKPGRGYESTLRGLMEERNRRVHFGYGRTPPEAADDSGYWTALLESLDSRRWTLSMDSLAQYLNSVAATVVSGSKKWNTTAQTKALPPPWQPLVISATTSEEIVAVFRLFGVEAVANRLSYLRSLSDDDPEERPIDVESLRAMALFLMRERQLPDPQIGITLDGLMQIEWRMPPSGILAMEFRHSEMIRFAAISPSLEPGVDRHRVAGTLVAKDALAAVRPFTSLLSAT